jgi:hypothetical protein
MDESEVIGRFGLPPRADDLAVIRDQLAEMARLERAGDDAFCSLDVQFLCGAGFDATLRFLRDVDSEDARAALAYILECDASGDFAGHDAPGGRLSGVLEFYRNYYRVP